MSNERIQLVDKTKEDSTYQGNSDPEAQNDNEPDCFQSLMDKVSPGTMDTVKDAKNSSPPEFVTKMCSVVCGLGVSMFWLIPLSFVAIAMIVVGAVHKDHCPGQHYIPIWMIVFGSVVLLNLILNILRTILASPCCSCGKSGEEKTSECYCSRGKSGYCLESIVSIFLFVWVIVGSVWVFGYFHTYRSPACATHINCCAPAPYIFSFAVLILMYASSALALLVTCCCCCCCLLCCGVISVAK